MDPRAAPKKRRPWWRLHVTTLIAVAAVGSALGYCESRRHHGVTFGPNASLDYQAAEYGWPLGCLDEFTMIDRGPLPSLGLESETVRVPGVTAAVSLQSDASAAFFDLAAVAVMLLSTLAACEAWRRRRLPWWQFDLKSLFVLIAIGAIVATAYSNNIPIPWCRSDLHPKGQTIYRCGLQNTAWEPTPWYITVPMLFGIGCIVFASSGAAVNVSTAVWRLARSIGVSRRERAAS